MGRVYDTLTPSIVVKQRVTLFRPARPPARPPNNEVEYHFR